MALLRSLTCLIGMFLFIATQSVEAQVPLTPNSKFACVASTPKNKVAKIKKSGGYHNTTFKKAKTSIKSEKKKLSDHLDKVNKLINQLAQDKDGAFSWTKSFSNLSQIILGQSAQTFDDENEKLAALNSMVSLLQNQILERDAQLAALKNCKDSQFSSEAITTYKFAIIGHGTPRPVVFVIAVAPAASINTQKQYCGHVPSILGGSALVALPRYFGTDACYIAYHPTDGCAEEIGPGNLGVWVTRWELNSPQTDAQLDGVIGQLSAIYNGTAVFKALEPGEFCS